MIEVSELSKRYGPVQALDRVSFEVGEGEILGFLGPNGAGKSTAMRIITGFLPGDSGRVRVAGFDVRADSLEVRRRTGYLPEGVPVYPEMRVIEYLRFRAKLKGVPRRGRKAAIERVLERAGVSEVRRRILGTLSRGYRQRVGLADALLAEPRVMVLDEPTVGLDPEQVRQFRQIIRETGRDRTVILSTHILSEVELICSRVVIIHRGRILAQDSVDGLRRRAGAAERTVAEVAASPAEIRRVLGSDPRVRRLVIEPVGDFQRVLLDTHWGEDPREGIFAAARDRGWRLRELRRESRSLEDVFVDLVAEAPKGAGVEPPAS